MSAASERLQINPCFRFGLVRSDGRQSFRVRVLRAGEGWQDVAISQEDRPRVFSLLSSVMTASAEASLELSDEDAELLRGIGFLLPAPLPSAEATARSATRADNGLERAEQVQGHPTLAHDPPPGIEFPKGNAATGPVLWLGDAATGTSFPYWPGTLAAAARLCLPGVAAPPLDPETRRQLRAAGVLVTRDELDRQRAERTAELSAGTRALESVGYAVIPALVPAAQRSALRHYYRALIAERHVRFGDGQVERRFAQHNEPVARLFLSALSSVVSAVARRPVRPAYAYFASYREGAVLKRHRDRPQCELSISLLIDYEPGDADVSPWPLWLARGSEEPGHAVHQRPGDGIVYKGCDLDHWRTALPRGHRSTHLFLHYVSTDFSGLLD